MTAEHEVHVHITVSETSYAMTCTACGEEIIRAATGDKTNRQKAADLGWKLASGHLCQGGVHGRDREKGAKP
jgi:hypothetical protein